jgi:membrane protease YdiL (CAAX protease family)
MRPFQLTAVILTTIWLMLVVIRSRRPGIVLIGGLLAIGLYTLVTIIIGKITLEELGLGLPIDWLRTIGFALAGLAVILAYSPLADRLATAWFKEPPTLETFGAIQQSSGKLVAGITAAWALGGILEELVARGIVLRSVESLCSRWVSEPIAAAVAILVAAAGAGLMHSYQGQRAMVIIAQISALFGILFVASGHNLWAVMLCHGLYDSIAFVRFATKKSKYSKVTPPQSAP